MTFALIVAIVVIAALDSLNPSLFLGQFYLMTTPNPVRRMGAYIAGLLTVNFVGGVLFLAGFTAFLAQLLARLSTDFVYATLLAIGVGLVIFGLWLRVTGERPTGSNLIPSATTPGLLPTFGLGALIMLNELTTALPYVAAIERISAAGLPWASSIVLLLLYNLVFSLPLLLFLVLFIRLRVRFTAQIERISNGVHVWTLRIFKYGALVAGIALIAGAGLYFGERWQLLAG